MLAHLGGRDHLNDALRIKVIASGRDPPFIGQSVDDRYLFQRLNGGFVALNGHRDGAAVSGDLDSARPFHVVFFETKGL